MKPDKFVRALEVSCSDSAVSGCIQIFENPPGRKPSEELIRISHWYKNLPEADREFVREAMRQVADATLFGVLCVIDGVRVIEDEEEKSEFKLTANRKAIESQLSPSDTYLHDLLRSKP